jgi:hypothetical protein
LTLAIGALCDAIITGIDLGVGDVEVESSDDIILGDRLFNRIAAVDFGVVVVDVVVGAGVREDIGEPFGAILCTIGR